MVSTCSVKSHPRRNQLCDLRLKHVRGGPLQKGPNLDTGAPTIGALRDQSDRLISISAAQSGILPAEGDRPDKLSGVTLHNQPGMCQITSQGRGECNRIPLNQGIK